METYRVKGVIIETQVTKSIHPYSVLAGIVLVLLFLFGGVGFAGIMGWLPAAADDDGAARSRSGPLPAAETTPQSTLVEIAPGAQAKAACGRCGVIESVREVEKARRNAAGGVVLAGGPSAAILGPQLSGRSERDLMTVLAIVVGAMFGNQIENGADSTKFYEVTVRFQDGSSRVLTELSPPPWKPGDQVKVINGRIRPDA